MARSVEIKIAGIQIKVNPFNTYLLKKCGILARDEMVRKWKTFST